MDGSIRIRRADAGDSERLAPLFDAYRQFYGLARYLKLANVFLLNRLARDESVVFFAREGGSEAVVGFVQLYPSFSSASAQRIWILNDLYVTETARRRGVATALLQRAVAFARCGWRCRQRTTTSPRNLSTKSRGGGWTPCFAHTPTHSTLPKVRKLPIA